MVNIVPSEHAKGLSAVSGKDPLRIFPNFMWKTWRSLGFPDPTRIHYDVADFMENGPDKQIDMGFRGLAKSYIAVTKANHALYCDPEEEIVLTVSATTNAAKQNSFFAWQMIQEFDWLAHLRPTPDQRQSTQAFDVRGATPKKSESFAAMSLFGQITGRRARLSIPDDIEIPSTSDTESARADLRRAHSEIPGAILLPNGREIMLGTAQNEQSIYTDLASEKGYAMRMWPAEYPKEEELIKFGTWLSPMLLGDLQASPGLAGTPTEPTRFSMEVLLDKERLFGRTEYARQFKLHLDAGAGNQAPLKLRDIPVISIAPPSGASSGSLRLPSEVRWGPSKALAIADIRVDCIAGDGIYEPSYVSPAEEWLKADSTRMYVDPSGMGTDETTWPIAASTSAMVFLLAVGASIEGHTSNVMKQIAADAKKWGVNYIDVESNFGQGMFESLLRPHLIEINHPCVIEEDRKGGVQKEQRIIATMEPATTSHRLVVNREVLVKDYDSANYPNVEDARRRFYRFTYQLTRITKTRGGIAHDDRVDGVASLMSKFVEILRQRTEDAQKLDKERAYLEEVRKLIASRHKQGLPTYGAELIPGMNLGADPFTMLRGGYGRRGSNLA